MIVAALAEVAEAEVEGFAPELLALDGTPPAGWVSLAELAREPGRGERLAAVRRAAGTGGPTHLPIAWEVEAVAWFVGALVGGPIVASGTLLAASPAATWVRIGEEGLAEGIAIDQATPGMRTGSGDGAGDARRTVHSLLAPMIESERKLRSRVLWWHAGDRIADAVLFCGQALGEPAAALRVAADLLGAESCQPWTVPLGVADDGLTRTRRTCCLSRRLDDGETCEGCPHA